MDKVIWSTTRNLISCELRANCTKGGTPFELWFPLLAIAPVDTAREIALHLGFTVERMYCGHGAQSVIEFRRSESATRLHKPINLPNSNTYLRQMTPETLRGIIEKMDAP